MEANDVDIALYVALREEFDAVLKALRTKFESLELPDVALTCYRGSLPTRSGRELRVLLVPAGKMGNLRSGTLTSTVLATFKPPNVVVLGIAGSVERELQPGDVFVPDTVQEYLANAAAVSGTHPESWEFQTSGHRVNTNPRLLNRMQNLQTAHPTIYEQWRRAAQKRLDRVATSELRAELEKSRHALRPRVGAFAGDDRALASGPAVGKSEAFARWIREHVDRKIAAIEMESAGVYHAAEVRTPAPRVLAIRGISDYADERKKVLETVAVGSFRRMAVLNAVDYFKAAVAADVFAEDVDHHRPGSGRGTALPAGGTSLASSDGRGSNDVSGTAIPSNTTVELSRSDLREDADLLRAHRRIFDRPAFRVTCANELFIAELATAIDDTTAAITTGELYSRSGRRLGSFQPRQAYRTAKFRNGFELILDKLAQIKRELARLERLCRGSFAVDFSAVDFYSLARRAAEEQDPNLAAKFVAGMDLIDERRNEILSVINELLVDAGEVPFKLIALSSGVLQRGGIPNVGRILEISFVQPTEE